MVEADFTLTSVERKGEIERRAVELESDCMYIHCVHTSVVDFTLTSVSA